MFKISIHKFLRILTTLLLVFAFALGVSGVKPARSDPWHSCGLGQ
jgi:hypothetical protein